MSFLTNGVQYGLQKVINSLKRMLEVLTICIQVVLDLPLVIQQQFKVMTEKKSYCIYNLVLKLKLLQRPCVCLLLRLTTEMLQHPIYFFGSVSHLTGPHILLLTCLLKISETLEFGLGKEDRLLNYWAMWHNPRSGCNFLNCGHLQSDEHHAILP